MFADFVLRLRYEVCVSKVIFFFPLKETADLISNTIHTSCFGHAYYLTDADAG